MKQKSNYGNHRQQGIALPIIMIILVLAALVTIYTTTTSVKEQQVTADQYRSEQAFSTAQAGIDVALERHNNFESFTLNGCDPAVAVPPETNIISDCTGFSGSEKGSFEVMFCDIWDEGDHTGDYEDNKDEGADKDEDGLTSASLMAQFMTDTIQCSNPIDPAIAATDDNGFKDDERVGILSVGKPDDASGRRTISAVSAPGFAVDRGNLNFVPLSARGSVAITGSIAVINRYQNITTWSGDDIDTGSAAVGTFINDGTLKRSDYPDTLIGDRDYRLAMTDVTMTPDLLHATSASKDVVGVNSDILDNDANLVKMTPEDMFKDIFSSDSGIIESMARESGQYFTDVKDIENQTGLIWLELTDSDSITSGTVGTFTEPAFLIVDLTRVLDPDLTFTISNESIHGMVFVFGNVKLLGSPEIYGSVVATGEVGGGPGAAGGGTVVYDPTGLITGAEGLAGLRGIEPGTWKDWGYVN